MIAIDSWVEVTTPGRPARRGMVAAAIPGNPDSYRVLLPGAPEGEGFVYASEGELTPVALDPIEVGASVTVAGVPCTVTQVETVGGVQAYTVAWEWPIPELNLTMRGRFVVSRARLELG